MGMQAKKLRELVGRSTATIGVGVFDAFSAKVAEQEGFELLSVWGSLVSRTMIGKLDWGYITQTEMLDTTRRIVQVVDVPVIVDCDDGFGDSMVVRRTVQLFEQIGVAGLLIDDKERPLRSPSSGGSSLMPVKVMVQKVRAAIEARSDPNLVIIHRTDNYEGVDEVISRVTAYGKAGADMTFVMGLKRVEDMERVCKESPIPLMAVQVKGSQTPLMSPHRLEAIGYKLIIYNRVLQASGGLAMRNAARKLKNSLKDRTKVPDMAAELPITELEAIVGLAEDLELQKRYTI